MILHEADWVFEEEDGIEEPQYMLLSDGRKTVEADGCDWKENPATPILRLTKLLKKYPDHEIVEISDGSDTLWYGIVPCKLPKSEVKRKSRK